VSLQEALREANRRILQAASDDRALAGMGTTCTALVLRGDAALCAHVGDSRLYLVRDARIYQMTEDDSVVQRMVADGSISRAAARHHAERNVILRALGTRPDVEITTWNNPLPVQSGDRFVVCSDGLSDLVPDDEIRDAVLSQPPGGACHRLVRRAREQGGYDNITVAVAEIRDGRRVEPPPPETRVTWVGVEERSGSQ
jgi:protein phosphatase